MTTLFNSCVTYAAPFEFSPEVMARWKRNKLLNRKADLRKLTVALKHESLKDKYKIWREFFWSGQYEDYRPDLEFPKFLDNYERLVANKLKRLNKA